MSGIGEDLDKGMVERFTNPDGQFKDDYKGPDDGSATGGAGGDSGGDTFTPSTHWDFYKSKLPEDQRTNFKLPENLTKENELELLDGHFKQLYTPNTDGLIEVDKLHPFVKEVIELAKTNEFNPDEFIKSKSGALSLLSASDDDLIKMEFVEKVGIKSDKNPNGLTEDEIKTGIESMNILDKRAKANEIRERKRVEFQRSNASDPEVIKANIQKHNTEVITFANDFFEKNKSVAEARSILGIDIGESNFAKLKEAYVNDFSVNKENKITGMEKLDQNLMKVYMFLTYEKEITDAIKASISSAKNEGREGIFSKLFLTPQSSGGGSFDGNPKMTEEEIASRFGSPEGTF